MNVMNKVGPGALAGCLCQPLPHANACARALGCVQERVTCLMAAAAGGHTSVVQMLLASGASTSPRNPDGEAAIDIARVNGFSDTARAIDRSGRGQVVRHENDELMAEVTRTRKMSVRGASVAMQAYSAARARHSGRHHQYQRRASTGDSRVYSSELPASRRSSSSDPTAASQPENMEAPAGADPPRPGAESAPARQLKRANTSDRLVAYVAEAFSPEKKKASVFDFEKPAQAAAATRRASAGAAPSNLKLVAAISTIQKAIVRTHTAVRVRCAAVITMLCDAIPHASTRCCLQGLKEDIASLQEKQQLLQQEQERMLEEQRRCWCGCWCWRRICGCCCSSRRRAKQQRGSFASPAQAASGASGSGSGSGRADGAKPVNLRIPRAKRAAYAASKK